MSLTPVQLVAQLTALNLVDASAAGVVGAEELSAMEDRYHHVPDWEATPEEDARWRAYHRTVGQVLDPAVLREAESAARHASAFMVRAAVAALVHAQVIS